MLLPCFTSFVFADDAERTNIAPNGLTYQSSNWNGDSSAKYLNNGVLGHSYQMWRPSSPERPNGAGLDSSMQYCGMRFNKYYKADEMIIYMDQYSKGENNIKITIKALMLGEWFVIGEGYHDDAEATDIKGSGGNTPVCKLTIKLNHPVATEVINTKNIKIECSEYGAHSTNPAATEHDWWKVPILHEAIIYGTEGFTPPWDVPEGAVLTTNAALSGLMGATSSSDAYNPGLGGDDKKNTYWKASNRGAGESIWATFDGGYKISNVSLNFGGCAGADAGLDLKFDVKLLMNELHPSADINSGDWKTIVENATAKTVNEAVDDPWTHNLPDEPKAYGVMVTFTSVTNASGKDARAVLTEMGALIATNGAPNGESRCVFLSDFLTQSRKDSSASGNLACYGSAYASSVFYYSSIADVSYINDGMVAKSDPAWYAAEYTRGIYCGVTLKEKHDVHKVVLYFADPITGSVNGDCVMSFDVQVKVGDEFKTIARATSFDETTKTYTVSVEFAQPVNTDDVRIVFLSNGTVFPYIKEMEIFEKEFVYSSYSGYVLDSSRTLGGPLATTAFADKTSVRRARYLDLISPIQYFNVATKYGINVLAWL